MIRFSIFLVYLLSYIPFLNAQTVNKTAVPTWVTKIDLTESNRKKEEGAFNYLLIDLQDNLIKNEQFVHYAVKILNGDGVQELSDISASFDPEFQTLEFHAITIIRNGELIEKLANASINTYQRETNLERSLYDGSLTSVVNLTDVREGDIIEYSYTIKGFNPVNKGNYATVFYQQYTLPVDRIFSRLITSKEKKIFYKTFNAAKEPNLINNTNHTEYVWDNSGLDHMSYDTNVPYWYNTQSRVSVSTFPNWESVGTLLNPLYQVDNNIKTPIEINNELDAKEDIILKLIRFVQDEIRYLGFEAGIGAYKPNRPSKVLDRRYGDCKDKSLLLSSLLQNQGVTAYPILVSTQASVDMDKLLPSHYLFNHCIVYLEHSGKKYFIDPTISNQGGNLSRISTPDYKFGFVLKEGSESLTPIPKANTPSIRIVEDIIIDSIGGNASFTVQTEYTGTKADYMRSYFKNSTEESINKEYLTYYSNLYPSITSTDKVSFEDDSRPWENIFTTNESYYIENIWFSDDSDTGLYFETYALVLESLINYTKSAKRDMPYYASAPFNYEQVTRIMLPEPWNVNLADITINTDDFSYQKNIDHIGNLISINHNYKLRTEVIKGNKVPEFLSKHDKIKEQLGFQLTYNPMGNTASNISWLSLFLAFFCFSAGVLGAIGIYYKYNPNPQGTEGIQIGGWLILPAIGLVLTPFVLLFQIFSENYFHKDIWNGFHEAGYENADALNLYLGFEFSYNILFFIYAILLIVLFFKKRSNVPMLMVFFYGANLVMILFGSFVLNQAGINDPTFAKDLFRSAFSALIWIPYFLMSTRVKNTFVISKNEGVKQHNSIVLQTNQE